MTLVNYEDHLYMIDGLTFDDESIMESPLYLNIGGIKYLVTNTELIAVVD